MVPWIQLGIWAVSTALYWLTREDPKEPEKERVETPHTKEGSPFPVFWGTVAIDKSVNVKFRPRTGGVNRFLVQDVVCLGYIDVFFGMFVGGRLMPYGIYYPPPPHHSEGWSQIRHFDSEFQPESFRETKKYEMFIVSDAVVSHTQYSYGTFEQLKFIGNEINNTSGWAYVGVGFDNNLIGYPYPDTNSFLNAFFSISKPEFEDRDEFPMWNYLTMMTTSNLSIDGGSASRSYKVQRIKRNLVGEEYPPINIEGEPVYVGDIFNYKSIIPEFYYPVVYRPYVHDFNICFSQRSVNPMYILKDILTSPLLKMKLPESIIHVADFEKCAVRLYEENFGLNVILDSATMDSEKVILEILSYIKGFMYFNLKDNKIHFKLARPDYNFEDLDIINEDTVIQVDDYTNEIDGRECPNSVTVNFINRFDNKDYEWMARDLFFGYDTQKTVTVKNDEDIALRGLFEEKISRPWVSDPDRAYEIAKDYLFMSSAKLTKLKITGNNHLNKYHEGDVVKLNIPRKGINDVVFRIFSKSAGKLEDGTVSLSVEEDVHGVQYGSYNSIPDVYGLCPITKYQIREPLLWEIFNSEGSQDIAEFTDTIPYRFDTNKTNAVQLAYTIYYKLLSEGAYTLDTSKGTITLQNNIFSLKEPISSLKHITSTPESQNEFREASQGDVFLIGSEIVKLDNIVLKRGCYDSDVSTHEIETICVKLYSSSLGFIGDIRKFVAKNSENYNAKIATVEGLMTIDLDKCPENILESGSIARYERPLNCTGVKINGNMYYYESLSMGVFPNEDLIISWNNKDRHNCCCSSSIGVFSIYDVIQSNSVIEENCSYVIEFLDELDAVIRTVIIPYTTQNPTTSNSQHTYSYADMTADFPAGNVKFRMKARRQIAWSPDEFIYSLVDRVVELALVSADLTYPRNWFLYNRYSKINGGKAYSYTNIFYPEWYGHCCYLFSTYSLSGSDPPYPDGFLSLPSYTNEWMVPFMSVFLSHELLNKTWINRTRAIVDGTWHDEMITRQVSEWFPPHCAIREITKLKRQIYVASNTDYWSDWFDTDYNYELYMVFTYSRANEGEIPDKNPENYPQMPIWSTNIEDDKIDKYSYTEIEIPVDVLGDFIAVYARAKAKLTRISDSAVFWTHEYFVKSWLPIIPFRTMFAYKSLRTFPAPIITITEEEQPTKWAYTITASAPAGSDWGSEAWEWRPRYLQSTSSPEIFDVDPNKEFVLTGSQQIIILRGNRLAYLYVIADVILGRVTDTRDTPTAVTSPQTYAEEQFL